jgi:hypothetical protein
MCVNAVMVPLICGMHPIFVSPRSSSTTTVATTTAPTTTAATTAAEAAEEAEAVEEAKEAEEVTTAPAHKTTMEVEHTSMLTVLIRTTITCMHSIALVVSSPLSILFVLGPLLLGGGGDGGVALLWSPALRLCYELETFHLFYFFMLYVPFHTMACGVTWSRR